jgi:hypothetical protein
MQNHATAVLSRPAGATPVVIDGEGPRDQQLAKSTNDAAKALAARLVDLMLSMPDPVVLPESEGCLDCHGAGITGDDGSFTDMRGWPVPCRCITSNPAIITALMAALRYLTCPASPDHYYPCRVHPERNALPTVPLSRSRL